MIQKNQYNNRGVSPVIGVMFMVAIAFIIAFVVSNLVLDIENSESTDIDITVQETSEGIMIDIIQNDNVDTLRVDVPHSSSEELNATNKSIHTINEGSGSYTVYATLNNSSEQKIDSIYVYE